MDPVRTGDKVCVDSSQTLCRHMWPLSKFNKAKVEEMAFPGSYMAVRSGPGLRGPGRASGGSGATAEPVLERANYHPAPAMDP